MNVALLTISSLSLVTSLATLAIMAKTAHELKEAKIEVEANLEEFKTKTERNVRLIRTTLNQLEM